MRPERGFSLVAALFVMVIVALVVVAMARLSATQNGTLSLALQQARAYQAARAGLEWGIAGAVNGGTCQAGPVAVSLAGTPLAEFAVQVGCSSQSYSENEATITLYWLTSTAANGTPGAIPDYAYRQLSATVER
jgi:MSHA biogenesis protein MshP